MSTPWRIEDQPVAVEMMKLIKERRYVRASHIQKILNRSQSFVQYHASELSKGNFITKKKFGRSYVYALGNEGHTFLYRNLNERYHLYPRRTDYTARLAGANAGTVSHDLTTASYHAALAESARSHGISMRFGHDVLDMLPREMYEERLEKGLQSHDVIYFDAPEEEFEDLENEADELFSFGDENPHLLILETDMFTERGNSKRRGRAKKAKNSPRTITRKHNVYYNAYRQKFHKKYLNHATMTVLYLIDTGWSGEVRRSNFMTIGQFITDGAAPRLSLYGTAPEFEQALNEGAHKVLTTKFLGFDADGNEERTSIIDRIRYAVIAN